MAKTLARLENYDAALAELDAASKKKNPAPARFHLLRLRIEESRHQLSVDDVIASYTRFLDQYPVGFRRMYLQRAHAWMRKGDVGQALKECEQFIRRHPNDPTGYFHTGSFLSQAGRLDEAIAEFDRALAVNPWFLPALNNRANMRSRRGDVDGAIKDLTRAIDAHPDDPSSVDLYSNRAIYRQKKEDIAGAIDDLGHAIRLRPDDADKYRRRGQMKIRLKDYDGGLADLDDSLKLKPSVPAYGIRGDEWIRRGDYERAIADLSAAIELVRRQENELQDRVRVVLRPGQNVFQFKLFQGRVHWDLRARLEDPETGEPLLSGPGTIDVFAVPRAPGEATQTGTERDGFFTEYLVLGPYANKRGCSPGRDTLRQDWLCDGETSEANIVPAENLRLGPPKASGCASGDSAFLGEGFPILTRMRTRGRLLHLNSLKPNEYVMAYAWIYVRNLTDRNLEVNLALSSDDSVHVKLNGEEILNRSDCRGSDALDPPLLRHLYYQRGMAWLKKAEPDAALADFERVLELDPKRVGAHTWRGLAYIGKSDYRAALAEVDKLLENAEIAPRYLYRAARIYAEASVQVAADETESKREQLSQQYTDRAVELLGMAIAKGWDKVDEASADFQALRTPPEFQRVLERRESLGPEESP